MNPSTLRALLDNVAKGNVAASDAEQQLLGALQARPFEDLGFARVDHHRALRQGFPEVVLGLGKSPAQIAAIAREIVSRGSTLLVTRASEQAFEAVRRWCRARCSMPKPASSACVRATWPKAGTIRHRCRTSDAGG
jgi:NCAIR mutase (PurE)-related protein